MLCARPISDPNLVCGGSRSPSEPLSSRQLRQRRANKRAPVEPAIRASGGRKESSFAVCVHLFPAEGLAKYSSASSQSSARRGRLLFGLSVRAGVRGGPLNEACSSCAGRRAPGAARCEQVGPLLSPRLASRTLDCYLNLDPSRQPAPTRTTRRGGSFFGAIRTYLIRPSRRAQIKCNQ